jgi:predicted PurR-regulated permease PerM
MLEQLDRVVPPESRGRRLLAWGVVAWTGVGIAVVIGLIVFALSKVAGVLPYLAVAGLVVLALNPLVKLLGRIGMHRRGAATLVFGAVAIGVPPLLAFLIQVIVDQGRSLVNQAPGLVGKGGVFARLAASDNSLLHAIGTGALNFLHHHQVGTALVLDKVGEAAAAIAHIGLTIVFGGILGYVILLSLPEIGRGSLAMVPRARREQVTQFLTEVARMVTGYVRARLIVSAAVGTLVTIGLWAIGMPFWLVLGIFVGIANLIPVLGSWIGAIPVLMVALLTKQPPTLLAAAAIMIAAHLVDGWILSPIVIKGTLDLHPVVTLLAVVIGAELWGFWGALIAVPIAGLMQYAAGRMLAPYRLTLERAPEPADSG